MRKYLKNDLCKIMDQLINVNEVLIKKGNTISQENAQGILTDCQQSALDIGTEIEKNEGEGTQAVAFLEEYCEKVYLLFMTWNDISVRDKELKQVRFLLNKVKNAILYDIPDSKKVVVFLPYKVCMWDSLESVWMAAERDENCEAYVVPIPYFDKNPNGSFRKMHYEGSMYPSYVPITPWEEFDLQRVRPDVIFIHNPYDNCNHVTSVHPKFYCRELKAATEQLVYIPYFVHQNNRVAEHYCSLPGVLWADKVILQSEEVKEKYMDVYAQVMEIQDKKEIQNKFLALGSPKFDKIDVPIEVPKEWKALLEGENKKILFFNTHLSGVMKNNYVKFIKKLEWVFEMIKKQEDVVLLWRPHPLTMETIRSMNKEAEDVYIKLVETYKKEKIGIYDDTPDLHRAIGLSTAYYGSRSSVAELFQNEGKPVMYMNMEYLGEE